MKFQMRIVSLYLLTMLVAPVFSQQKQQEATPKARKSSSVPVAPDSCPDVREITPPPLPVNLCDVAIQMHTAGPSCEQLAQRVLRPLVFHARDPQKDFRLPAHKEVKLSVRKGQQIVWECNRTLKVKGSSVVRQPCSFVITSIVKVEQPGPNNPFCSEFLNKVQEPAPSPSQSARLATGVPRWGSGGTYKYSFSIGTGKWDGSKFLGSTLAVDPHIIVTDAGTGSKKYPDSGKSGDKHPD